MLTKDSCSLINRSWIRRWSDGSSWSGSCCVIERHAILISETHTYARQKGREAIRNAISALFNAATLHVKHVAYI